VTPAELALASAVVAALAALFGAAIGGAVTFRVAKGQWEETRAAEAREVLRRWDEKKLALCMELLAAWDDVMGALLSRVGDEPTDVHEPNYRFYRTRVALELVCAEATREVLTQMSGQTIHIAERIEDIATSGERAGSNERLRMLRALTDSEYERGNELRRKLMETIRAELASATLINLASSKRSAPAEVTSG
jgi:hypothetical protein